MNVREVVLWLLCDVVDGQLCCECVCDCVVDVFMSD